MTERERVREREREGERERKRERSEFGDEERRINYKDRMREKKEDGIKFSQRILNSAVVLQNSEHIILRAVRVIIIRA